MMLRLSALCVIVARMSNPNELHQEIENLAVLAVTYDQHKDYQAAIYYYEEAVHCLQKYLATNPSTVLKDKLDKYRNRAQCLRDLVFKVINDESDSPKHSNESKSNVQRLEFLLNEALNEDEQDNHDDALESYLEAIETGLSIKSSVTDERLKQQLTILITKALERAEWIKQSKADKSLAANMKNLQPVNAKPTSSSQAKAANIVVSGQDSYTKEEIVVLRQSSNINNIDYVPFLAQIDLREKFFTLLPFSDPCGLLALSSKQKSSFVAYRRVSELCSEPSILLDPSKIDCFAIKQTVVTDCSFIASLTVSALYERRFSKKLITPIIYPQNSNRQPVYNPCGKYMIKLNLNGIWRKIIIDDYLPLGRHGQLLCSYSSNSNEFWISLLEKAYMKVMGGYDFPGSNSNIDLHALTGWIPERLSLDSIGKDKLMKMMMDRYGKGDMLATFATGDMTDAESDRTGLVATHAYAMLEVKHVQGNKLFLLKNPWSHVRWKGKFSERDLESWTPELQKALQFNPKSATNFDNGVFWMDIDSLFRFFDVCYVNWNPSLFGYTYCTHDHWKAGLGPAKDLYYMGDNPQYSLVVKNGDSSVWILLTRHIMDRNDFARNHEYIALIVYKNNGEKVYIPCEPQPFIDGARINSPHYLCKIVINKSNPVLKYTLVVSQYEKSNTILYTLRAYSTSPFLLKKIVDRLAFQECDKHGQWTRETAGGCPNFPASYGCNPVYSLTFNASAKEEDNELLIELRGPKAYAIGFEIRSVNLVNANSAYAFKRLDSGSYRRGYTYLKIKPIPAGTYQITPTTFEPQQIGPFFLSVRASHSIKLARLRG